MAAHSGILTWKIPWTEEPDMLQLHTTEKKVKVLAAQSCPTVCNPADCRPSGSSVHGILQARILEWVAISHFLLQGIFPTQGSNLGLLHYRQIL